MIILNFQNVDDVVIYDKSLQRLLPKFGELFNKWKNEIRMSAHSLAQRTRLQFLNDLSESDVKTISDYLGQEVKVESLDYLVTNNIKLKIDDKIPELNSNLCFYRNNENIYITTWK